MKGLKKNLLAKRFILAQIVLVIGAILAGFLFPQRFNTTTAAIEKWQQAHPFLGPWLKPLGLDHVYTTWWFATLLTIFLLALVLSTMAQYKHSKRATFGPGGGGGTKIQTMPGLSMDDLKQRMQKTGYLKTYQQPNRLRFIKHPGGYWGNVLLHLGMVLVISSSLLLVLTEVRGLLHLFAEETHSPGDPWIVEETGIFGKRFLLPSTVRLDQVTPEYWDTDDIKQLTMDLSFIDNHGAVARRTVAVNRTANFKGIRIYQGRRYGDAFFVKFTDDTGKEYYSRLQLEHPSYRDEPSYGNFAVPGINFRLKAKYFADAQKITIDSVDPLLVLRLVDEENKVAGQLPLRLGEKGKLGTYKAELMYVRPWAGVIFVKNKGMAGIFAGFIILVAGATLTYFLPPRDIVATVADGAVVVFWRATRFAEFYEDEYQGLTETLGGGPT